jgi:hypothetical protein
MLLQGAAGSGASTRSAPMKDLLYVLLVCGFFAISWAYVRGMERL